MYVRVFLPRRVPSGPRAAYPYLLGDTVNNSIFHPSARLFSLSSITPHYHTLPSSPPFPMILLDKAIGLARRVGDPLGTHI